MFIVDDGCIYIFALSFVRVDGILACCDVDYVGLWHFCILFANKTLKT